MPRAGIPGRRRGGEKGSRRHGKLPRQEVGATLDVLQAAGSSPAAPAPVAQQLRIPLPPHRLPSNLEFRLGAGPSGSSGGRVSWGGLPTAALPALDFAYPLLPSESASAFGAFCMAGVPGRAASMVTLGTHGATPSPTLKCDFGGCCWRHFPRAPAR